MCFSTKTWCGIYNVLGSLHKPEKTNLEDNTLLPYDTFDLDGDSDTCEDLSQDLPGFPRRADILTVTDTGIGLPPIASIGAYESQNRIFLPFTVC